ncbi:MAG TPA: UDP-N-acetylmuramyl-tripeptide synthetase [Candidatus Bathyarchaeia archaeon]|nr:UDP-N-acetylmuramyl-tripeptide synthetase [Candidatus Bathyarchaeia archaeon]
MKNSTYPPLFTTLPVTSHTDYVTEGSTFVVIKGLKEDGVRYIPHALAKGAKKIVVEKNVHLSDDVLAFIAGYQATMEYVDDAREALAVLSAQASGEAAKKLIIVGATGTKGKTTTAYMLATILRIAQYKTALISTVFNMIDDAQYHAPLTTPNADYLHQFFAECVAKEVKIVVMEVAAQAYTMKRVHGIQFDGLIFTNIEPEHGEFYENYEEYCLAKMNLTKQLKRKSVWVYNRDDDVLEAFCKKFKNNYSSVYTYGFSSARENNNFVIKAVEAPDPEKIKNKLLLDEEAKEAIRVLRDNVRAAFSLHMGSFKEVFPSLFFAGIYNIYNMAAAVTMAYVLGVDVKTIMANLLVTPSLPGRFDEYDLPNGAVGIIDYAHTATSYEMVLREIRRHFEHVIVVCGAGGERDTRKRPWLGAIAASWADMLILTSDNPRSEDPLDIAHQMMAGVEDEHKHKVLVELDREKAIKKAYAASNAKSAIVLLGKGTDNYQIIGSQRIPFNEAEILNSL